MLIILIFDTIICFLLGVFFYTNVISNKFYVLLYSDCIIFNQCCKNVKIINNKKSITEVQYLYLYLCIIII